MPAAKPKPAHGFNGEMRVSINRSVISGEMTDIEVMELVQSVMEGEEIEGIKVEYFEVRGKDRTEEATDGTFSEVTPFMVSAEKVSGEAGSATQRGKLAGKKGKKKH